MIRPRRSPVRAWPGQPVTAHSGVPDPAAVEGDDATRRRAFGKAFTTLHRRISLFTNLPLEKRDGVAIKQALAEIGRARGGTGSTA